jgi:type IV pilus biogenesis protein CpaD/CtpE
VVWYVIWDGSRYRASTEAVMFYAVASFTGAGAQAKARELATRLNAVPVKKAAPHHIAMTVKDGVATAIARGKPLLIWVGGNFCPNCVNQSKSEFVHCFVDRYQDVKAPAVVVAIPDEKDHHALDLWWVTTVPGAAGDGTGRHLQAVRRALAAWRAGKRTTTTSEPMRFAPMMRMGGGRRGGGGC